MGRRGSRLVRLWLLCLLLLPALAGCGKSPALPHLAPDAVVLAFGDSLTHGTGAGVGESYPVQLEQLIGRRVVQSAVPGETSAAGLQRLPQVLDEVQPDIMVLCLGGNDFLQRLDNAQTERNLRAMVLLARQRGIPVVLIGVPKFGLGLSTAPLYEQLADELKLPLEDEALADILSDPQRKSDQIHPNAAGYRNLAEAIAQVLQSSGAIDPG